MRNPLIRLSAVLALALGMGALAASPSSAAAPVQSCAHVSGSATFNPGLSSVPQNQTVNAKGTETSCTPSAATGGSGALKASIKLPNADCNTLVTGGQTLKGTGSTTWMNGHVSKYTLTFKTGTGNKITTATITGKVTSGLFKGHKVTGQVDFQVVGSPNCTTKPVKKVTFTNTKPLNIV